jgi:hypothetical protein
VQTGKALVGERFQVADRRSSGDAIRQDARKRLQLRTRVLGAEAANLDPIGSRHRGDVSRRLIEEAAVGVERRLAAQVRVEHVRRGRDFATAHKVNEGGHRLPLVHRELSWTRTHFRPARAAAAATCLVWSDCTPPIDTSVSQPVAVAMASATRYSSLRVLLLPNASPLLQSSRLAHTRAPPRWLVNRSSSCSGDGPNVQNNRKEPPVRKTNVATAGLGVLGIFIVGSMGWDAAQMASAASPPRTVTTVAQGGAEHIYLTIATPGMLGTDVGPALMP